jgi:ATP-dependent DNA ligase
VTKTLAELQTLCCQLGIAVLPQRRARKDAYIEALRWHFWTKDNPGVPLPEHIEPMLLANWDELAPVDVELLGRDNSAWIAQEKIDGVRALFHITAEGVRLTSRSISDVTFRLYDWDHVDAKTGQPQAVQVDQALACIDFVDGAAGPVARSSTSSPRRRMGCAMIWSV